MGEPLAYDIHSREPVEPAGALDGYETPFERANSRWEQANETVVQLGTAGLMDPKLAAQLQHQSAIFEMLTAIHEQVERIARNTEPVVGGDDGEADA